MFGTVPVDTNHRRNPLWFVMKTAVDYGVHKWIGLDHQMDFDDLHKVAPYIRYTPPRPTNLAITEVEFTDEFTQMNSTSTWYIFGDGSIRLDIGGVGINVINKHMQMEAVSEAIGVCYDINLAECYAIERSMELMIQDHRAKYIYNVRIITDNQNAIDWISGEKVIQHTHIYEIVLRIYQLCQRRNDIQYELQKIKGHRHRYHNRADELAKAAVTNYLNREAKDQPIAIGYTRSIINHKLTKMMRYHTKQWIKGKTSSVISTNMMHWNILHTYTAIKRDMQLARCVYATINQLRTQHIRLNRYKMAAKCPNCDHADTVEHLILECKTYQIQRAVHLDELFRILMAYNDDIELKDLLFPSGLMPSIHRMRIMEGIHTFVCATRMECTRNWRKSRQ
eukprot:1056237_1